MESTKSPKRVIKKRLKNVDKAIVEIAQMKFKNFEEKEEKLDALVFLKNQILREAEELQIKWLYIYISSNFIYIPNNANTAKPTSTKVFGWLFQSSVKDSIKG